MTYRKIIVKLTKIKKKKKKKICFALVQVVNMNQVLVRGAIAGEMG